MILLALALLQAGYSPEVDAVMTRSRARAAQRREEERAARAAPSATVAPADAATAAAAAGGASAAGTSASVRAAGATFLPLPPATAKQLQQCLDAVIENPDAGLKFAQSWALSGGGFSAQQCRGFALSRAEQWDGAAQAFDAGALEAQKAGSPGDAARLWGQAGNAALAGGMAAKAQGFFDTALGVGLPNDLARGELFLDRARAMVALGQPDAARGNIDEALKTAADDPLAWLLSATLARRQGDLARARKDIAEAHRRSPDDASVALEEGNIAILTDDAATARTAWERAEKLSPDGPQGQAARESLAQLSGAPDNAGAATPPTPAAAKAADEASPAPMAGKPRR